VATSEIEPVVETIHLQVDFSTDPDNPKWLQVIFSDGEIWTVSGERFQDALKEFVRHFGMLKVC